MQFRLLAMIVLRIIAMTTTHLFHKVTSIVAFSIYHYITSIHLSLKSIAIIKECKLVKIY